MDELTVRLTEQQRECQRECANEIRKMVRRLIGKHPGPWHSETLNELYKLADTISDLEKEGIRPHVFASWQTPLLALTDPEKVKRDGRK